MHFKGVELTKSKTIKYCLDNSCTNLVPICCLFITQECSENFSKWYHLSAGEHVCSTCYNYLHSFFSYDCENSEIYNWKQSWLSQSQDNPTIFDYITTELFPNWYCCCDCGKWRQINRDISLSSLEISRFSCHMIFPFKNNNEFCSIPEDKRIEFIRNHPATFFDSVKYSTFLSTVPHLEVFDQYNIDSLGIAPTARNVIFDFGQCNNGPCDGFMRIFSPFARENSTHPVAGAIDAVSMDKWEYETFPAFTGPHLRPIFVGLRNLMLTLWAADPRRPITVELMSKCILIRGLMRVCLLIHSVPDLIKIYSAFGYINFGLPCGEFQLGDDSIKRDIVVVGASLSGIAAARHLSLMGANVTVLEADHRPSFDSDHWTSNRLARKMKVFDSLHEVYGIINNPFSIMAHQCNIEMKDISTNLSIFNADGQLFDDDIDHFYQNLVYSFVGYLMEGSAVIKSASAYKNWSLGDLYREYRKSRIPTADLDRSDTVSVENVYLSEIEYRVFGGASLENIPHDIDTPVLTRGMFNFSYKHFSGQTTEPVGPRCWSQLIDRLGSTLDVRYSTRVESIAIDKSLNSMNHSNGSVTNFSNNSGNRSQTRPRILLHTNNKFHSVIEADQVLFSMPPWQLCRLSNTDWWLSANKNATNHIVKAADQARPASTFLIVQLAYTNENVFWRRHLAASERSFAIAPRDAEWRGFCHLFKESVGEAERGADIVLQTRIFGKASQACSSLSDQRIVEMAIDKMSCLATETGGPIPWPLWFRVVRLDDVLLACSEVTDACKDLSIVDRYKQSVFVRPHGCDVLNEPISLSNSFCLGMDAAATMLKGLL